VNAEQTVKALDVGRDVADFVSRRVGTPVAADRDLFASGLVSSLFAMELVVHLEKTFSIAIQGDNLKRDNFRTVDAMTALVLRLRGADGFADA
jgi:methoxymalonate biosynthesis acyl carrier protein